MNNFALNLIIFVKKRNAKSLLLLLQLLIQKKIGYQTAVVLDYFLSFVKNWNVEIKEKFVWPEIASKVTRVKPFFNFNVTECKLIMKEVFINE